MLSHKQILKSWKMNQAYGEAEHSFSPSWHESQRSEHTFSPSWHADTRGQVADVLSATTPIDKIAVIAGPFRKIDDPATGFITYEQVRDDTSEKEKQE